MGDVTIAALYVEADGCYVGLPGVDPWDKARDARRERGGRHGAPLRINLAEAERLLREGKTVSEAARAIRCSRAALHYHYTAEDARRFARLGPKRLKQPK